MISRIMDLFKRKKPSRRYYSCPSEKTIDDDRKVLRGIEASILRDKLALDEIINSNHGKVCMVKKVKVMRYYGLCGFNLETQKIYTVKYLRSGKLAPDYLLLKSAGFYELKREDY